MRITPFLLTILGSAGLAASGALSAAAPTASAEAKFLGYNIFVDTHGASWQTRHEGFHAFWKTNDFDVVALQEVGEPQLAEIITRETGYDYVVGDRSDGYRGDQGWYEFAPIFYKRDRYTLERHGSFWVSETPDVPGSILPGTKYHGRTFNWVILKDRKTAKDVLVGNIHIHGLRSADEIRIIRDRLKALSFDGPIVLLGDFNMTPTDAGYPYITKDLGFTDASLVATKVSGPKRTIISGSEEFTWKEDLSQQQVLEEKYLNRTIDFTFFCGAGSKADTYSVETNALGHGLFVSDHFAQVSTLKLSGTCKL